MVDSDVPDAVRTKGGARVTDEALDGGTVVDVAGDEEGTCVSYVRSDSGVWLSINPGHSTDEARRPQLCGFEDVTQGRYGCESAVPAVTALVQELD